MKQAYVKLGVAMAIVLVGLSSCLKDKEDSLSPYCSITAFGIGNITTRFYTTTSDGLRDSSYTRVIDGSTIGFNIDQVNGVIESVDSIVAWADISRVVPQITYTGMIFLKQRDWSDYYSMSVGTDSVDFNSDVEILLVSSDEQNSKLYKVKLNKAQLTADSLYWAEITESNLVLDGNHRSLAVSKTIYVFAENGGTPSVTHFDTENDATWSEPKPLSTGTTARVDYRSVTLLNGQLYALADDGQLYTSNPAEGGTDWQSVGTSTSLQTILAADSYYLYAFDGTEIKMWNETDGWQPSSTADLSHLPAAPVCSAHYTSRTNSKLEHVVMLGVADTSDEYASAWYKLSSADSDMNQTWNYLQPSPSNTYLLPAMQNLQLVAIGQTLYAFGGAASGSGDTTDAYATIYSSVDNGLSWHPHTSKILLPKQLAEAPLKPCSAVAIDSEIWLMQSGGKLWKGMIGKQ